MYLQSIISGNGGVDNESTQADVYLMLWQSNAEGSSSIADLSTGNIPLTEDINAKVWYNTDYTQNDATLQDMVAGVNTRPGLSFIANTLGFETSLMKKLGDQDNRTKVLVKLGVGGTGIDPSLSNGLNWTDDLYDYYINNYVNPAKAHLESLGYTVNFKVLILVGGERDASSGTASNISTNQINLYNKVRTDIKADLPIIDIKINTNIDAVTYPDWETVNTQKDLASASSSGITTLDFSHYGLRDDVHYNADGYALGGANELFNEVKDL